MTCFIVYCQSADLRVQPDNPSFGRFDLIARCVGSALWLDGGLRDNTIHFYLAKSHAMLSFSNKIKQVSPDERSILMWIEKVFSGRTNPGITLEKTAFEDFLKKTREAKMYVLDRNGEDIDLEKPDGNSVFILSDNLAMPAEIQQKLAALGIKPISIGPNSYLSSQAISFVNIGMDRFWRVKEM